MCTELREAGFGVKSELALLVVYRGRALPGETFRVDLLVNDLIIVELKSVEQILGVHKKQLLTYLRLADKPLGLLINFNETVLKQGIHRVVNGQLTDA
jgi:GxxExxY protein